MNLKKIKVYHLFWIVSLLIIIIGALQSRDPNAFLDINIHDTYYVIGNFHCTVLLFICYFLMGTGYWIVQKVIKKRLVKFLTITHSTILIGSFIFYWIISFINPQTYSNSNFPLLYDFQSINIVLVTELMLILFIATPIYIINLLIGLFRKAS